MAAIFTIARSHFTSFWSDDILEIYASHSTWHPVERTWELDSVYFLQSLAMTWYCDLVSRLVIQQAI